MDARHIGGMFDCKELGQAGDLRSSIMRGIFDIRLFERQKSLTPAVIDRSAQPKHTDKMEFGVRGVRRPKAQRNRSAREINDGEPADDGTASP